MQFLLCLFEAFLIGIAVAAPIGPINMILIRKALEAGFPAAVAVGLGAACADGVYGLVAALGLTAISAFLLEKAVIIKFIGGLFLFYLAYKDIRPSKLVESKATCIEQDKKLWRLAINIFFLTLTSPMTILSFIGIFASIGDGENSLAESLTMVIGIFIGSISWSLFLGTIMVKIKHKLSDAWLNRIRYISAACIGGFGVWAIYSSILVFSQS